MAGLSTTFLTKLEEAGLGASADNYIPIFKGTIDMQKTMERHMDAFGEHVQYMEEEIAKYAVELPDSTSTWVPMDFIRYIYKGDSSFRFRLSRFVKGLTRNNYRNESDEVVFNLDKGPLGNSFLSWDMTIALFLHESKPAVAQKGKDAVREVSMVDPEPIESDNMEETLSEQVEASMALILLHQGDKEGDKESDTEVEDLDRMLDPEEMLDEVPDFDVRGLYPIIVDGEEFLFLDDVCKCLGLREDEALSIITNVSAMPNEKDNSQPRVEIDFCDHELTKALEYKRYDVDRTMEENAAAAIVQILEPKAWYESVPESAFQPHKPLFASTSFDEGSINISKPSMDDLDKEILKALPIDKFAARRGGVRGASEGRDSSLWHYMPNLSPSSVRVFHLDYSDEAFAEILKCKALSSILCEDPLTTNANKCILIMREASLYMFGGGYTDHVLSRTAASLFQGVSDPSAIAETIGTRGILKPLMAEAVQDFLKKM